MDPAEAKQILEALANGVDPSTGEVFSEQSPFNHPPVIRALFCAVRELEKLGKPARSTELPSNAGKPWSADEDARLVQAFDEGMPIKELAQQHARSKGSITSRLIRLGRLQGAIG
jgi:hypothetical protein